MSFSRIVEKVSWMLNGRIPFFFGNILGARTGKDRQDTHTDIWTDRLLSENIILDEILAIRAWKGRAS